MLTLVDTETGREMHVHSNNEKLRARYAEAAAARDAQIVKRIRAAGGDHLRLATDRDWLIDIVKFVAHRRVARPGAPRSVEQRERAKVLEMRSTS